MQRYTVTIVASGTECPVLLVPFQPSAIVAAFVDELYKRVARRGLPITGDSHSATLRLNSDTGAIIDPEDVFSDVVQDPKNDTIFAVFALKELANTTPQSGQQTLVTNDPSISSSFSFRIVTVASAKNPGACPIIHLPPTTTIRQLRDSIADHLDIPHKFEDDADTHECNCQLADQLTHTPGKHNSILVVHGKSAVERIHLDEATETSVYTALRSHLGSDLEATKNVRLLGGSLNLSSPMTYKKPPVVAVCSKQRHISISTRAEAADDKDKQRYSVLDLHTSEIPIHPVCMDVTLERSGLSDLAIGGIIDIYCVNRRTTGENVTSTGKSSIFRARPHWEPSVAQSSRGMSMFLSSLWVFASLVQGMQVDESLQDSVFCVFDTLTKFPPALRTLYILTQGKTPDARESAALSHAMYGYLDSFMSNFTDIIGSDHTRVFEGGRLLFGYILDKARALKLSRDGAAELPYVRGFETLDLRDYRTGEAVMHAVLTSKGLVEACLFECFQDGGSLASCGLQIDMEVTDVDPKIARISLLSGGVAPEIISLWRLPKLNAAFDLGEMLDLSHLAELCTRNKLAVHMPRQLPSSIAPCLTFDCQAHLAVYTGEEPCATPGQSSVLSRPFHGDETIDVAVIEQLIAPILKDYQDNGTAVFDQYGGAVVKRLLAPDEILMFCVDTSASMRRDTDFAGVNDSQGNLNESDAQEEVEPEFYNLSVLDEVREQLCDYEGFNDMVAMLATVNHTHRHRTATKVLDFMRNMLLSDITKKAEDIEHRGANRRAHEEVELNRLKTFWAGLKTHEDATIQFLLYRATTASPELFQRWTWSTGDEQPKAGAGQRIPSLSNHIVDLPHHLRCPISHALMLDAVTAADGHTYSRDAITHWFRIRKSSPMTGLPLTDINLKSNQGIGDAAQLWMDGGDIPDRDNHRQRSSKRLRLEEFEVTFDSRDGSFGRKVRPSMTLEDLYKLAFCGLKARFLRFQLSTDRYGPLTPSSTTTIQSCGIRNGSRIIVRIAEDNPSNIGAIASASATSEQALIKVFKSDHTLFFSYWVCRDTAHTLSSVIWKYWRFRYEQHVFVDFRDNWLRTNLKSLGDGLDRFTYLPRQMPLSTYLTRSWCDGHLGDERAYREEGAAARDGGPLVLKLTVADSRPKKRDDGKLSRLDVLKQMFEALINRILAYGYNTHVGLVTFATKPALNMGISHVLENFRRAVSNMKHKGDTALWDALALGMDQLIEYGKKYPDAKKRIVCISDGSDTSSMSNTVADIGWRLREADIVVDSISLGNENNDLRALSYLLGAYRFHPVTLANALAICELEPFLSLTERPTISPPTSIRRGRRSSALSDFTLAKQRATTTVANEHRFPERKLHPNLNDDFVQLSTFAKSHSASGSSGGGKPSQLHTSRLLNEIRATANNAEHPNYDVYVSEADMSFWKIVMSGPEGSPYAEGTFLLYLDAEAGRYPTFAPKARFVTRIKHPNVNAHGRICHSIFDRDWTTDVSMTHVLNSVYALLFQPEYLDPVSTTAALGMHRDDAGFADEARAFVHKYATKSRAEWRLELLGGH